MLLLVEDPGSNRILLKTVHFSFVYVAVTPSGGSCSNYFIYLAMFGHYTTAPLALVDPSPGTRLGTRERSERVPSRVPGLGQLGPGGSVVARLMLFDDEDNDYRQKWQKIAEIRQQDQTNDDSLELHL